ncbi:MAG TPA: isoprenylcysteine carboxylmethyltransferase family protein [Stellaceae bacterium]|nr:isoprenylcysteine carboxylmethyltransferase family protein [Stellaceae bacterium]
MNALAAGVVVLVALERLAELWHAQRNTRALLADGGIEVGRGHYPLMVALHAAWLLEILLTVPAEAAVSIPLLAVFAALQGFRVWVLMSLGRFWTTRVITVPGAPLVRRGPYRFLRHPNYVVVAAEIAVLPLAFGAWAVAAVFSALNAGLLAWRISLEDQALAPRRQASHTIP